MTDRAGGQGNACCAGSVASRGHFHTDDELVAFARDAGFREARIGHRYDWSQLLVAQP
ncbi:MAG TPA: hypothetical protein VFL58_03470 [Gaiellaceae bacterium]|nr:hypothetical protein [Gaiellaceae bacterium]